MIAKLVLSLLLTLVTLSAYATTSLTKNEGVFISQVRQAIQGPKQDKAQTQQAALALKQAFKPYTKKLSYHPTCVSVACLGGPKTKGYRYYVSPQFVHWENQGAHQTGRSNAPELKLTIFEISSKQPIISEIISTGSSSALIGGNHSPSRLLNEAIQQAVNRYYQVDEKQKSQ